MKHEFTTRLLAHVSTEISTGNGLRAMFWANQYLNQDDPLRLGFLTKLRRKMEKGGTTAPAAEIFEHLKSGGSLTTLDPSLREYLRRTEVRVKQPFIAEALEYRRSHTSRTRELGQRRSGIRRKIQGFPVRSVQPVNPGYRKQAPLVKEQVNLGL